jgi:zinc transporter
MQVISDPQLAHNGVLFAIDSEGRDLADPYTPSDMSSWSWRHLAQTSTEARDWVLHKSGIPIGEAKAMIADHARPRCTQTDQGLLFIGRGVNLDPASVPEDVKSIRVWVDQTGIVTVVKRRMRSAESIAQKFGTEEAPQSPAEVLIQLFAQMMQFIAPVVQELGDQLDEIQDTVIDENAPTAEISDLSPLRLRAVSLHRYLAPMYDASITLCNAPQLTSSKALKAEANLIKDQLGRIVEELAAIDSRASVTRDEIISQRSDQLNQRVYTLTVLAGVCLPLSVLTGMLGMNVGGVPLAETPLGFWLTTLGMMSLMGITLGVLRLIKWI